MSSSRIHYCYIILRNVEGKKKKKSLSFLPRWEVQTPLSLGTPRLLINLPRKWLSHPAMVSFLYRNFHFELFMCCFSCVLLVHWTLSGSPLTSISVGLFVEVLLVSFGNIMFPWWFFLWSCMDVRVGLWRRLSAEDLMLLNCGVGEESWESLGLQGDPTSPF